MQEIMSDIQRGKDTTPGRDGLGYQIFKHLDEVVLEEVLASIQYGKTVRYQRNGSYQLLFLNLVNQQMIPPYCINISIE